LAEEFYYGGQAVLEGVMMRGQKTVAVAVRRPDGGISLATEPLSPTYTGGLRKIPLVRGLVVLIETLVLGIRALLYSANVAVGAEDGEEKLPAGVAWGTIILGLGLGVALFFVVPLFITHSLDTYIKSSVVSNVVEGGFRIVIFLAYLWAVNLIPDVRRVFAYHGAEHKAINAYEAGVPLETETVKKYSTAHTRCGTAFLLVVMVLAILVFAFIGRPTLWLRVVSRVVLIPVIAGLSYELIRFQARHVHNTLVKLLLGPSMALQRLTTRQPQNEQIEVALAALKQVLEADKTADETPSPV
jgi:uncharacterized protein YqhQ